MDTAPTAASTAHSLERMSAVQEMPVDNNEVTVETTPANAAMARNGTPHGSAAITVAAHAAARTALIAATCDATVPMNARGPLASLRIWRKPIHPSLLEKIQIAPLGSVATVGRLLA